MVTATLGESLQVSPSLLRPCALRGGADDSALTGLQMESSDVELSKEILWFLENVDAFNAECAVLFNSGAKPRASSREDVTAAAGLFANECLPGEELHLITQRLIFRLGCRDPVPLARIGEIFTMTVASYHSDGGIGAVEFRGYVAALLTQALQEMEHRSSQAPDPRQDFEEQQRLPVQEEVTFLEDAEDSRGPQGLRGALASAGAGFTVLAAGLKATTAASRPTFGQDEPQALFSRNAALASRAEDVDERTFSTPPPIAPVAPVALAPQTDTTPSALLGSHRENCEVPTYTGQVVENLGDVTAEVAQTATWRERLSSVQQSLFSGLDAFADKCDAVFAPGEEVDTPACDLPIGGTIANQQRAPPACQISSHERRQTPAVAVGTPQESSEGVPFRAAPSGGLTVPPPPMQRRQEPQQQQSPPSLEIEARRALRSNGLSLYCFEAQTWIPKRALLSGDRRTLFFLEAEGVPQLEECASFRLADMRQMTRRTAPGRHLLSLHFEEGTVLLRFSYPEFLVATIATILADGRKIPLVEGRWDD